MDRSALCRAAAVLALSLSFVACFAAGGRSGGTDGLTREEYLRIMPQGPMGLAAEAGDGVVVLRWQAPPPPPADYRPGYNPAISHYRVLRRENDGDFEILGETASLSWEDRSALRGHAYTYAIMALHKDGTESAFSEMVDVKY
jgi:hypothetical protein